MMRRSDSFNALNSSWMLKCGKVSEKCKTNLLGSHSLHIFGDSHHLPGRQVDISLLDLLQVCDELGERVPVDHQALHLPLRVSCVCDDVGCPHLKAHYEIYVSYFQFFLSSWTSSPLRAFSPKKSPLCRFLMNLSSALPPSFIVTCTAHYNSDFLAHHSFTVSN